MSQANSTLKGKALNNLANACWWHKHPNFHYYDPKELDEQEEDHDVQQHLTQQTLIDSDYETATQIYKKSLYFLEGMHELNGEPERRNMLNRILMADKIDKTVFDSYVRTPLRRTTRRRLRTKSWRAGSCSRTCRK